MTDQMGYKNIDRVYDNLAQRGKLSKESNGRKTLDLLALNMMTYMARKAIDKDDKRTLKEGDPYWCYWEGWDSMAAHMGMILPSDDQTALTRDGNLDEDITRRKLTARNRLSRTARFLVEQGCIKQLKPPVPLAGKNAVWLLLLGKTPEENRQAEIQARLAFGLPFVD